MFTNMGPLAALNRMKEGKRVYSHSFISVAFARRKRPLRGKLPQGKAFEIWYDDGYGWHKECDEQDFVKTYRDHKFILKELI